MVKTVSGHAALAQHLGLVTAGLEMRKYDFIHIWKELVVGYVLHLSRYKTPGFL